MILRAQRLVLQRRIRASCRRALNVGRPAAIAVCALGVFIASPSMAGSPDDVSVWSSSVLEDILGGIYPIGGSGEINGEFAVTQRVVDTETALELGLRARLTDGSPIVPAGGVYEAPFGSTLDDRALWSYDLHLDFGSEYLGDLLGMTLVPKTMEDYVVRLQVDTDPTAGTAYRDTVVPPVVNPIQLLQSTQNVLVGNHYGAPLPGLTQPGLYDIRLALETLTGGPVLSTQITVRIVGPLSIPTLGSVGAALLALFLITAVLTTLRRRAHDHGV